jgi:gas vesicle protein
MMMKKVISWVKNLRPLKMLTILLAGTFLFFSQACGSVAATTPRAAGPNSQMYVPKGTETKNPPEGGMNNFSDVDRRARDTEAAARARAEALKENAEQNVIDETSTVGENTRRILDKKGENVQDLGENLKQNAQSTARKAQSSAEDFGEGTKKGLQNIQQNTADAAAGAAKNVKRSAEDAATNAQRAAEDTGTAVNRTFQDATDEVSRAADKVS